jgi:hypothetical protein
VEFAKIAKASMLAVLALKNQRCSAYGQKKKIV